MQADFNATSGTTGPFYDALAQREETENFPEIICGIAYERMQNPAELPCGHVFEDKDVRKWIAINQTCPDCRAHVTSEQIKSAFKFQQLIGQINEYEKKVDQERSEKEKELQIARAQGNFMYSQLVRVREKSLADDVEEKEKEKEVEKQNIPTNAIIPLSKETQLLRAGFEKHMIILFKGDEREIQENKLELEKHILLMRIPDLTDYFLNVLSKENVPLYQIDISWQRTDSLDIFCRDKLDQVLINAKHQIEINRLQEDSDRSRLELEKEKENHRKLTLLLDSEREDRLNENAENRAMVAEIKEENRALSNELEQEKEEKNTIREDLEKSRKRIEMLEKDQAYKDQLLDQIKKGTIGVASLGIGGTVALYVWKQRTKHQ